jgi:Family of unknown function (DUF6982)
MTMPTQDQVEITKLVVALLDGRRLKGHSFNFSTLRQYFDLFPQEGSLGQQGTRVELKDVKAVFFVKDFAGNPGYAEALSEEAGAAGRSLEITFADGEKIVGKTNGYDPQKLGFFLVPTDPNSNNIRIFIVNKNVRQVRHGFRRVPRMESVTKA